MQLSTYPAIVFFLSASRCRLMYTIDPIVSGTKTMRYPKRRSGIDAIQRAIAVVTTGPDNSLFAIDG